MAAMPPVCTWMTNATRADLGTPKAPVGLPVLRFAVGLTLAVSGALTVATFGTSLLLLAGVLVASRRARLGRRGAAIAWALAGSVVGCLVVVVSFLPTAAAPSEQTVEGGWALVWVFGVPQMACAIFNAVVFATVPLPRPGEPQADDSADGVRLVAGTSLVACSGLGSLLGVPFGCAWWFAILPGAFAGGLLIWVLGRSIRTLELLAALSPRRAPGSSPSAEGPYRVCADPTDERRTTARPLSYKYSAGETVLVLPASSASAAFLLPADAKRARAPFMRRCVVAATALVALMGILGTAALASRSLRHVLTALGLG